MTTNESLCLRVLQLPDTPLRLSLHGNMGIAFIAMLPLEETRLAVDSLIKQGLVRTLSRKRTTLYFAAEGKLTVDQIMAKITDRITYRS